MEVDRPPPGAWPREGALPREARLCHPPPALSSRPHEEKGVEGRQRWVPVPGLPKGMGGGLRGAKPGLGSQSRPQAPRTHFLRLRLTPQTSSKQPGF